MILNLFLFTIRFFRKFPSCRRSNALDPTIRQLHHLQTYKKKSSFPTFYQNHAPKHQNFLTPHPLRCNNCNMDQSTDMQQMLQRLCCTCNILRCNTGNTGNATYEATTMQHARHQLQHKESTDNVADEATKSHRLMKKHQSPKKTPPSQDRIKRKANKRKR